MTITTRRDLLTGGLALTVSAVSGDAMSATSKKFLVGVPGDYERLAAKAPWHTLGEDVEVVFFDKPFRSPEATVKALKDFDALALMRERTPLPRAVLERLPRLKLIVFSGPSNQAMDHAAAAERNIVVCNAARLPTAAPADAGESSRPRRVGGPAELTFALMLACAWSLRTADQAVRGGEWTVPPAIQLNGKTLGIVGYGGIGGSVGRCARAFDMRVLGFSRSLTDEIARADGITKTDLETLMRTADVISVHLPLTAQTRGFLGSREIGWIKPGAILVNTARAQIVDEAAMLEALRTGRIASAGFDVYSEEPLPRNHPLTRMPNVIMTPHIGWVSAASLAAFYAMEIDVIASFRQGVVTNRYTPSA